MWLTPVFPDMSCNGLHVSEVHSFSCLKENLRENSNANKKTPYHKFVSEEKDKRRRQQLSGTHSSHLNSVVAAMTIQGHENDNARHNDGETLNLSYIIDGMDGINGLLRQGRVKRSSSGRSARAARRAAPSWNASASSMPDISQSNNVWAPGWAQINDTITKDYANANNGCSPQSYHEDIKDINESATTLSGPLLPNSLKHASRLTKRKREAPTDMKGIASSKDKATTRATSKYSRFDGWEGLAAVCGVLKIIT